MSETPELEDVQRDPQPGSVLDFKDERHDTDSSEQHCCNDCGKQYRRVQELRRHTRDKHEQQRRCPFCHITWSRPVKIRAHLMTEHGELLIDEAKQELLGLRGWRKTIRFLARCATTTPP